MASSRRRNEAKGGGYSAFKSDMKSVIDAAALQHDIAQRFSLPGSKMAIQVSAPHFFILLIEVKFSESHALLQMERRVNPQKVVAVVRISFQRIPQFALNVDIL
jgi:hypothetical protein